MKVWRYLATLFNVPSTIDGYYKAAVNHDMPAFAAEIRHYAFLAGALYQVARIGMVDGPSLYQIDSQVLINVKEAESFIRQFRIYVAAKEIQEAKKRQELDEHQKWSRSTFECARLHF